MTNATRIVLTYRKTDMVGVTDDYFKYFLKKNCYSQFSTKQDKNKYVYVVGNFHYEIVHISITNIDI